MSDKNRAPFTWADAPSQTAFPIARAGYPYIVAAAFTTAVLSMLGWALPAFSGLLITAFICYFFRDPDRLIPNQDRALVAPADGKVVAVVIVPETHFYDGPCRKVSIFMSVFNVHVNRMPLSGTIRAVQYRPGKFGAAQKERASLANENNAVVVETADGKQLCVVQIAGLIARRIICKIQPGDAVERGQRFGMICFGSRVDLYLPQDTAVQVNKGDKVTAGASIIGYLT